MLFAKTLFVAIAGLGTMAFAAPIEGSVSQLSVRHNDPCDGKPNHKACDKARHKGNKKPHIPKTPGIPGIPGLRAVDAAEDADVTDV